MEITVDIDEHGPIFDGRALHALIEYEHEMPEEVARGAKNDVLAQLGRVIRHPTPYYETRIRTDPVGEEWHVWDGPDTFKYGPWLEGTGSRNATTRFKGYHSFMIIHGEWVGGKAKITAERVLIRFLARMQ
jgi:hypothetical protein